MKKQIHNAELGAMLELPADLNARVDKIVALNDFTKRNFLLNAVNTYLEDYEDLEEALEISKDPNMVYYTSEELDARLDSYDKERGNNA